jgi:hypothetical protein
LVNNKKTGVRNNCWNTPKNGVVSKNSRRRVQCLNKECPFNQVYRNVLQLQTHLAAPTSGLGSENRCRFVSPEVREYYQGVLADKKAESEKAAAVERARIASANLNSASKRGK